MSQWDDIDAITEELPRIAIERYGFSEGTTAKLLAISENANFRVHDPVTGQNRVMRVLRQGYHDDDSVRSELAWVNALREDTDLLVPAALPADDGRFLLPFRLGEKARRTIMFECVEGGNLTLDDMRPDVLAQLGAISAKMHAHSRSWRKPAWFTRYHWNLDSMLHPSSRTRFGYWRENAKLSEADRTFLDRAAARITEHLDEYSLDASRIGLSHGDLHVLNLMLAGDDLWAIDFDDCGIGWYMQDIAPALAACAPGDFADELKHAWLDGYREVGELTAADIASADDLIMLRRFVLLGWCATHPEADPPLLYDDLVATTVEAAAAYLSE